MNSFGQKNGNDYSYVYRDTMEFINIIIEEYGFYDDIISLIRNGETEISIKKKKLTKTIEENWVRAIEDSLVALDTVIRKPSIYIKENEVVMPIELSRSINARSIQHLSQHTDYISKIEGDTIIPSKILNVFRDETNETYENKFVNTLIDRLYLFVDKRYDRLFGENNYENSTQMEVNTKFVSATNEAKINFSIELFNKKDTSQADDENLLETVAASETPKIETAQRSEIKKTSLRERVEHIRMVVQGYYNSEFVKSMDKKYVRPPIIRTNAITKNKDLRQCLMLWEFIESYDGIGCQIEIEETAESPNGEYINELYSLMALQYVMFKVNINENLEEEPLAENITDEPLMPKILTDFAPYDVEDYSVHDVEYKKLFSTDFSKRLTADQIRVRTAVDVALEVDKMLIKLKVLEQLEEEKRRQEVKLLEEKRKLQELEEEKQRQIQSARKKKLARKVKKQMKKKTMNAEDKSKR